MGITREREEESDSKSIVESERTDLLPYFVSTVDIKAVVI